MNRVNAGSNLEAFLEEEGLFEEARAVAVKRLFAWQLKNIMREQNLSKVTLAKRMCTSRSTLDRLLDPQNQSVTLLTLQRAAKAVGAHLEMNLVFH